MDGKDQFLMTAQPQESGNGSSNTIIDARKALYGIINARRSIEGLYCKQELLKKMRGGSMTRLGSISFDSIEEFLSAKSLGRERSELILLISVFAYALTFSLYTIAHHATFNTYAWDLGIYNQALWSTAFSGKFFYYTCELYFVQNGSFFGIHFAPILLFLLPLYYLFPSPEFLLSFQSLIL